MAMLGRKSSFCACALHSTNLAKTTPNQHCSNVLATSGGNASHSPLFSSLD